MGRLSLVVVMLSALLLVPFLLWGDVFEASLTQAGTVKWILGFGPFGWVAAILLLMADLALPIPATVVMSAAGYLYGPVLGGLIAAAGSCAAGLLGYGVSRSFGISAAARLVGDEKLKEMEATFRKRGGWLIVLSRWLPLVSEVVSCLAGLARMPFRIFLPALVSGSLPLGFAFALIGSLGNTHPYLAVLMSVFVPPLLWALIRRYIFFSRPES